jgi:hypothetical protein
MGANSSTVDCSSRRSSAMNSVATERITSP